MHFTPYMAAGTCVLLVSGAAFAQEVGTQRGGGGEVDEQE